MCGGAMHLVHKRPNAQPQPSTRALDAPVYFLAMRTFRHHSCRKISKDSTDVEGRLHVIMEAAGVGLGVVSTIDVCIK